MTNADPRWPHRNCMNVKNGKPRSKTARFDPSDYEVNRFGCGCIIISEFPNGLGCKTIEYCAMHGGAEFLYKQASNVLASFKEGNHPTEEQIELLERAVFSCQDQTIQEATDASK